MDTHAKDEIDELAGDRNDVVRLRLGVEGDADTELELARLPDHAREVGAGLVVDGDAVPTSLGNCPEVLLRALDHQVAVEHAAEPVHERRDRLEDDRANRDRLHEVTVADVELEDARPRVHDADEICAEIREVGRVDRRLDLGAAHPFVPAHAGDLKRAMKNPDVR